MSLLDDILKNKKKEVANKKVRNPISNLEKQAQFKNYDFKEAISEKDLSIIAEVKRKSPSAGILNEQFDPVSIAVQYQRNGAQAISVLTDEKFFGGKNEHLTHVKNSVSLPLLLKDFIIDIYQIYEAASAGADAILLIVRILEHSQLERFIAVARSLNLKCLVEVHTEFELGIALKTDADIIGVNNRNLDTLETDLNTSIVLRSMIPENYTTVSESGIQTVDDIRRITDAGFDAVLIGGALMKAANSGSTLRSFLHFE